MSILKIDTTLELINNFRGFTNTVVGEGTIVETLGYSTIGDGGGAQWKRTGNLLAASQSPAQLGDARLSDKGSNEWALVAGTNLNIKAIGGDSLAADNASVFTAAENSNLIRIDLQGGSYTTSLVSSPQDQPLKKDYFNGSVFIISSITSEPELFKTAVAVSDYELKRPRTKSPLLGWEGLNVLWLGTSIPHQGVGVDGYPELFGASLKCYVDNMAFSGTSANYDYTEDAFDIGTVKSLSMTEDDRQWGLATYGASSAYDDNFDVVTKASQMTVDYRIKAPYATTPFDVVVLDHNHNDRALKAGNISPTDITINSITIGATTDLILSDASTIVIGDSITARVNGIASLDYLAARVTAKASNTITVNIDSSSYIGTFTDGTIQETDKATFYGAWQFLIYYIKNQAILTNVDDVKIILCGAPSEHTNDSIFENSVFRASELIKEIAEKYDLSFFDIGYEYSVKYPEQLTYFPDGVHPTTTITRKAIANYWVAWASGGLTDVVNTDAFIPSSTTVFLDKSEALYSDLRLGFYTPDVLNSDSAVLVDEDFSAGIGAWTTNGTAPVDGTAPWGVGSAVLCASTIGTPQSSLTQAVTGTDSWSVEFDMWLPEVSGLTDTSSTKTVNLCEIRPNGAAYQLQLLIKPESAKLRMAYFEAPNVGLVQLPASRTLLSKETKHTVRIDMEKATSGANGFLAVYLDGVRIISGATDDSAQVVPNKINIGVLSSNTGKDLDLYLSNILLTSKTSSDFTQRFTGNFTAQSGELVTVVNGIITTAV